MKTAFSRTFFSAVLILLAALLLVGASFQLLVRNFLKKEAMERLRSDGKAISALAQAYYADDRLTDRDFLVNLSVAASVSQSDAILCDAKGKLLVCSDAPLDCPHRGLVLNNRDFLRQLRKNTYIEATGVVQGIYTEERYVVATAIRGAEQKFAGFVLVSTPTRATESVLGRISDIYLFVSILVVVLTGIFVSVYARNHAAPLRDMARSATAFGHGDLSARVKEHPGTSREIQELALAFNNMADSLEKSEYQRKEFVANVSHELKTPMTTIGGYIDGILDGTIPEEKQRHYMQIVSDETKRLSRLVRSMLDMSRLQEQGGIPPEKKSRFELSESFSKILITFEQKITEKNLQVEVDFPEHPVFTLACEDYISQVLYNLLDNAVKFCPEGKTLSLSMRPSGSKVYLSVANEGETIPAEELPLVFDRFHKLDKSRTQNRDGWGLGLYIVKTIIGSHGENISVSSQDGKTQFSFTLPLVN